MSNIKFNIDCESCEQNFSLMVDESVGEAAYCPFCGEEIDYPLGYIVEEIEEETPWENELGYEDDED
jgi:rRNA maturation endonuclease Nob1